MMHRLPYACDLTFPVRQRFAALTIPCFDYGILAEPAADNPPEADSAREA